MKINIFMLVTYIKGITKKSYKKQINFVNVGLFVLVFVCQFSIAYHLI